MTVRKLILLFVLTILPLAADAKVLIDGIYYDLYTSTKTASVVKGTYVGYYQEYIIEIPDEITYEGQTYTVTRIDDSAFYRCNVDEMIIGNSVISIGEHAFDMGQVGSLTLGNSVTSIGYHAFAGCRGFTSITIPSSVTTIGDGAFWETKLTSIYIPKTVKKIGEGAFMECRDLTSIVVDSNNSCYDSRNDCNAIIETSSNSLIAGCKKTIIPNSVTSIGDDAFCGCSGLNSITIPNSVTSIGGGAFFECSGLISVTIPNSVISMGDEVFWGCSALTSVTIGKSVRSIGFRAFEECSSLTSVTIPNSVTKIGDNAFDGCYKLTSVNIPNSVTSIGKRAFQGCSSLTSITIPNSVISMGDEIFYGCHALTSVTIGKAVSSIGYRAFGIDNDLNSFYTKATIVPNANKNAFYYYYSYSNFNCTLYVPIGCKEAYAAVEPWNKFKEIVEMSWEDTESTYDVNGDGSFGNDDVSSLVGKVLGRNDGTESAAYSFDANKDDKVDITDVVQVIGLINDIQQGNLPETDDENEGGYEEPTETELQVMQMSSDEEGANETIYSVTDSLEYAALAQEVISRYDTDEDDDYNTSESRMLRSSMDDLAQEAIRMNGYNRFNSQLEIEQQNWDSKRWGSTRYGGFKTFYNTMEKNGKRYLLVVFYYKGGFPNKKTAYLKLGQLNSGKIICKAPIYTGQEFAALSVCIDDYLQDYGCFNVFPLLITEESKARNYLNPFLVKGKPIVDSDWRSKYYGYEFGKINGVSVYFNGDSKNGNNNQGNKWYQCVELCKRYVKELNSNINRKESDAWGNAINWPANRANDAKDPGKYLVFANDGREKVREGDLVIWNHGAYGHIGVVIKTAKDYISVAHQNGGTGTYASPIGTTMKLENGVIKDIKPGTNRSPIYKSIQTIPYFIRINSPAEKLTSYDASMRASTTNMTFAPTQVGKSVTKSIKIANSKGTGPLTISSITLSKGEAFSVDASSFTISPGDTHTFKVTFTPSSSGEFKDRIVIRSNADDNPTWVIHLSGSATETM